MGRIGIGACRPVRILHLVHRLPDPRAPGGSELHAWRLAAAQRRLGHEVLIAGADMSAAIGDEVESISLLSSDRAPWGDARVDDAVVECAREWGAEIAHIHHLMNLSASVPIALRRSHIPCVMTAHDLWTFCPRGQMVHPGGERCVEPSPERCGPCIGIDVESKGVNRWRRRPCDTLDAHSLARVRREALRSIARVIAPAPRIAALWVRLGVRRDRISVVPHGIEVPAASETARNRDRDSFVFGVLGSVLPTKGQEIAIAALEGLETSRLRLEIHGPLLPFHGDLSHLARIEEAAARDRRISIHGAYHPADLDRVLARLDAVLVPSIWEEHFGLTLHEALTRGLPVIASDIGALPDAIDPEETGLLIPPADPIALASAMRKVSRHEWTPTRCVEARSIEENALDICALLQSIVMSTRKRLGAIALAAAFLPAFAPPSQAAEAVRIERDIDLTERFSSASIRPSEADVRVARIFVGGEEAPCIFQHPDSEIVFEKVPLHEGARFVSSLGIADGAWERPGNGVVFELAAPALFGDRVIFRQRVDPRVNSEDRRWIPVDIPLDRLGASDLILRTLDDGDGRYDWAAWRSPRIVSSGTEGAAPPPNRAEPSLLLITIDTLRADHLGICGGAPTPTLDSLAAAGSARCDIQSHAPITAPSHAALLMGRLPRETGVLNNGDHLPPIESTLAEKARVAGMRTGAVVALGILNSRFGFERGFERFLDVPEGPVYWRSGEEVNHLAFRLLEWARLDRFLLWVHYAEPHEPYEPPETTGNTLRLVDASGAPVPGHRFTRDTLSHVPLLLPPGETRLRLVAERAGNLLRGGELTFKLPVLRLEGLAPEELADLDLRLGEGWREFPRGLGLEGRWLKRSGEIVLTNSSPEPKRVTLRYLAKEHMAISELGRRYAGEVAHVDRLIGGLLAGLRKLGLGRSTLVAVTADHGEALGERGLVGHVHHLYDHLLAVPILLAGPSPGRLGDRSPAGIVDLHATLLDLLSLPPLRGGRGRSLLAARSPGSAPPDDRVVFCETHRPQADRDRVALVTRGWKLIRSLDPPETELYELTSEGEKGNLAPRHPGIATQLGRRLDALLDSLPAAPPRRSTSDEALRDRLRTLGYVE